MGDTVLCTVLYKCRQCGAQVTRELPFNKFTGMVEKPTLKSWGTFAFCLMVDSQKNTTQYSVHHCGSAVYGTEPIFGLCDLVGIKIPIGTD